MTHELAVDGVPRYKAPPIKETALGDGQAVVPPSSRDVRHGEIAMEHDKRMFQVGRWQRKQVEMP